MAGLNLAWPELNGPGLSAQQKLQEQQQKLQEQQDLLLRQMKEQEKKVADQEQENIQKEREMEERRLKMQEEQQKQMELEQVKQLEVLQEQQQLVAVASVQEQALQRKANIAEQLQKLAAEKEEALAKAPSPLGKKLDEWIKNDSARRNKEAKMIENFLWTNAPHMDMNDVLYFQKLSMAEKHRVMADGSIAGAWSGTALMRARAKDPNEPVEPYGKKAKTASWDAPPVPLPQMFFITISDKSILVQKNMPNCCPVMVFDGSLEVFKNAEGVCSEAVGGIDQHIIIEDDPNWDQFPEVASVVFQTGDFECGLALAIAPGFGKWAVGLSTDPVGRATAAKLALTVSISFETPDIVERLKNKFSIFGSMWKQLIAGTALDPDAVQALADQVPQVHLLQLTTQDALVTQGLPAQGYSIAFSKALKDVFSVAHQLVYMMIGDHELDLIDDGDWNVMPGVGEAIKRAGGELTSYCIAVCKAKRCWAVGLGYSWKNRQSAAKLAMALVVGQTDGRLLEACEHYSEFLSLCTATMLITPEQAEGAAQRCRLRESMYNR